ncbi:Armadillo-like helical domain-containing protein 3 [Taenia solium]|eukprot:TsM_000563500 transcript=TsM_000563500 gene=TsM_000563500
MGDARETKQSNEVAGLEAFSGVADILNTGVVDQHCSSPKSTWEASAMDLRESVQNLKVIVKHFNDKISAYINKGGITSLTEAQVFQIIQNNYESLSLRVYKDLYKYYEQAAVDVDETDDRMLVEIVQSVRRDCLKAATAPFDKRGGRPRHADLGMLPSNLAN